jgi:hypothetical protein
MFAVEDIDETLERLRERGAQYWSRSRSDMVMIDHCLSLRAF